VLSIGKGQISTPWGAKTFEPILMKPGIWASCLYYTWQR